MDFAYLQGAIIEIEQIYRQTTASWLGVLLGLYPRLQNFSRFDLFVLLNLSIIFVYMLLNFLGKISPRSLYLKAVRAVFSLPFAKKIVDANLVKIRA